jgi:hypothetical protein
MQGPILFLQVSFWAVIVFGKVIYSDSIRKSAAILRRFPRRGEIFLNEWFQVI